MESPKKIIDDTLETLTLVGRIIDWASRKLWTRQLLIASVGLIVSVSLSIFLSTRWGDLDERRENHNNERELLVKEVNDQEALDYIQLCIDAEKSNDPNKKYYCTTAVNVYRSLFVDAPNSDVEKNIQLSAYGAMQVHTAHRLRTTAWQRFDLKQPRMSAGDRFMLRWGIWVMGFAVAISMLGIAFLIYRAVLSRQL